MARQPLLPFDNMEYVRPFLEEVTEELLYNIVYNAYEKKINYRHLSDTFERKTGHRPMAFFGFGNETGSGWFDFIKGIPGVRGKTIISICDDNHDFSSDDESNETNYSIYKTFNTTHLNKNVFPEEFVANYREMLLLKCCEIMKKDDFTDLSNCKDRNGNTPLHLIASLPGIQSDCATLVKYLLQAGVDPLKANYDGQTFLHIIFGRHKAKYDDDSDFCFNKKRITTTKWFVEDRINLLDILLEELTQAEITSLIKTQDKKGNTVMHECAFSSPIHEEYFDENEIYEKLFNCGGSLRVQNDKGELPLHYAFNPAVFQIFLQNGAVCQAKNDCDETPVLFMFKYFAGLAFVETSALAECSDQVLVDTQTDTPGRTFLKRKVLKLLENLTVILEEARETSWIPDLEGNVVVNVILMAVRLGSYNLRQHAHPVLYPLDTKLLRTLLLILLRKLLPNASPNDTKRQNKKGQSFLHVLLGMSDGDNHTITEEVEWLECLEILLEHNTDVNAVDSEGRTPLDIVYKNNNKCPSFYDKCATILTKSGAFANNSTRKLRSPPNRHLDSAQRLTHPNSKVAVVEKYRYSIEDPIGTGAFSKIFVAIKDENVDSRSGTIECRAYALKRLDKEKKNTEEIKREISTLLSISGKCENIIKCHEFVEDQFFQYLSLDLMDGDLREFVENGSVNEVMKADPAKPVQVTNEIIKGLEYLHEHKLIHRDIKPGNILYTTDPALHFKIADFGLTKNTSASCTMTSTGGSGVVMAPGTRCWMAPELVSMKSREHTKESDIFSLGLVLHYLLTLGKHPFSTANEEAPHVIERRIVKLQTNIDKSLHPEAASFIHILLKKDPSERAPASYLTQHPFLWSESKKIEFLKAVGDQQEAVTPTKSTLEQRLQMTPSGKIVHWDLLVKDLYDEMTRAWKKKKYRTDKVIDLIRFIRNAYAHKQVRSSYTQAYFEDNIFLQVFPSLVLDVFGVVQQLGFNKSRSSICQALR